METIHYSWDSGKLNGNYKGRRDRIRFMQELWGRYWGNWDNGKENGNYTLLLG